MVDDDFFSFLFFPFFIGHKIFFNERKIDLRFASKAKEKEKIDVDR